MHPGNSIANAYIDALVVRSGQGQAKGASIVNAVKKRFNSMYVVKWRLSCLNLSVEQSFALNFKNTTPQILGDSSFKEVPLGVDPSQWPLDIDVAQTVAEANANPVIPGGLMKVYGNFCWGGDKGRAEAYFIPAGTKPDPNASSPDPDVAKKAMQSLITQNMRGNATDANEGFVTFQVPDEEKLLEGTGDATVTHVIVYDNGAKRASGHDEKTILTLKASKKPFPWLTASGIGGAVVVFGVLIIVILRLAGSGGGGRKGGGRPPPQPVVAGQPPPYGGGYGGPPQGGYGGPPQGGGYGPPYGGGGPPYGGGGGYPNPKVASLPVEPAGRGAELGGQVQQGSMQCPSCKNPTPFTAGRASFCYSCGSPLPVQTGAMPYQPGTPSPVTPAPRTPVVTPAPYGVVAPVQGPPRFVIRGVSPGAPAELVLEPGREVTVGRDPAKATLLITEPRVSGHHATLKVDGSGLSVRDESSNNGVWIAGQRIPAGVWTTVSAGAQLRFGPIEFVVEVTRG